MKLQFLYNLFDSKVRYRDLWDAHTDTVYCSVMR